MGSQPIDDLTRGGQLLFQVINTPGWVGGRSIEDSHIQCLAVGASRFQGGIHGESLAIRNGVEFS